jgi:hypothetical protein
MAEFKLSRIRFNWKGSWSGGQDYIVDDMVEYIGYTYVCLRTHSAGSFTNDLAGTDVTPAKPKWKKQSEGVTWTGVWTVSTDYGVGNIVKYGASIYQCTEGHTSAATFSSGTDGLVADIGKWKVVAVSSADWKYNWTINTLYRINDLVRYNGKVYKATAQHVSAANTNLGLEANQNDWEVLSDSDTWRADWAIGTRYRLNDIVKYGGYVYKCIVGHTSADNATLGLEEDQSKWDIVYDGVEYVTSTNDDTGVTSGFWQAEYRYKKNDIVKRGGNIMRCLVGHTSGDGDDAFYNDYNSNYWEIWLPGSTYDEAWADNVYYQPNDLVLYGGYIYKALTFNVGLEPSNYQGTDWNLTFEGYRFRYDWNNPGPENDSTITDYKTGDVVRLSGSLYIAIQDSTDLQPDNWPDYWEKISEGRQYRNTWEDNIEYYQGDIVVWQGTSYVCTANHYSSESASRPDQDVEQPDQNYWKIMILGTRTNKLARLGDLKTFEDQDSTAIDTQRLAIGSTGQALRATSGLPTWDSLDLQENVYYVSRNGIDETASGGSLNAPFRTVRFAMNYLLQDEPNRVGAGATVKVMGGDFAEILPISIPSKVALVGSELRSTTIRPAVQGEDIVLGERINLHGIIQPQIELTVPDNNARLDMFRVRNGCGIRALTLRGLQGSALSGNNDYGTQRPIPGNAFVSLDPGAGPDDQSVWVSNKSTYVQGVTTIGDKCIGMKIDGALHNGGNRSIVANDFTQVISDGIGYWATNRGRSELVSVFTYYCHIGYLAENGGILRATNGNNSYGKFGSVSEGFDTTETPQVAVVDNQSGEATVDEVWADGNQIFALAYTNTGQTYTGATTSVTQASGTDLLMKYDEIRQGAISRIDLAIPDDSTNVGGNGFKSFSNTAQGGDLSTITLAASEVRTKAQLLGMRILIKEGAGAGQYGYIANYNASTKVATVYKDSDSQPGWDNIVPGKDNVLTLNGTTVYDYEPRVTIESPTFTKADRNVQVGSHDIGYSDTLGMWYYAPTGTNDWYTSLDTSVWTQNETAYARSYVSFAKTGSLLLGLSNGSDQLVFSNDGSTFDHSTLPLSTTWKKVAVGGELGDTIICLATGNANAYVQQTETASDSTVIASDAWTVAATGASDTNWVGLAYGAGKWIAISEDGTTVISTDNGVSWSSGAAVTPQAPEVYNDIAFGNNAWVATMAQSDRVIYSHNGTTWSDSQVVGDSGRENWVVGYTGGLFHLVSSTGTTASSHNAKYWQIRDSNAGMTSIAGGYLASKPTFVMMNDASSTAHVYTGGARAWARAEVSNGKLSLIKIYDPGSGYITTPTVTVEDPEEYGEPYFAVDINDGVLPQPIFYNRGTGYQSALIKITGDGFGEELQIGNTMKINGISVVPGPGANVVFAGNETVYRLVKVNSQTGVAPNISITFQISPTLGRSTAPLHNTTTTIRERYSSCRLTGHDFLDIGTGNLTETNYPTLYVEGQSPANDTVQANEIVESNGGRVFYTSTDQDGNFRVGELFRVSQAQGGVTLSADFFNLEGLDEIRLGGIRVGGTQAVIREFSTDNTFVANSDNIIPTQRALKAYIENRFTGGGSNLFTNELTAGQLNFKESTWANTAGSNNSEAMASVDTDFIINGPLGGGLAGLNLFLSARIERDDFNG